MLPADSTVFDSTLALLKMDCDMFFAPAESVLKEQSNDQTSPPVLNLPLPAYRREAIPPLSSYLRTWGVPPNDIIMH